MPTYEFRCPAGHETEKFFRKISDGLTEIPCSLCGQSAHRQVSAGAGLVFKGSGFYITDYGKDGKKDQRQAAAKSSPRTETVAKGDTSTAESTSAPKADSKPDSATASKGDGKPTADTKPKSDVKPATPKSGSAE